MILELRDIVVKQKDIVILKNISFNISNNDVCVLLTNSYEEKSALFKAFKDGKNLETGQIIFNEENITTQLPKKRPLALIFPQKFLFSIFSIPWKLTSLYLKNKNFYLQAKQDYCDAKHHLNDLIDNGINLDKKKYKDQLRDFNENFLKNSRILEETRINKYYEFINKFHQTAIKQIMNDVNANNTSILMQRFQSWVVEEEKLTILNSRLTFLQALWDKIFILTRMEKSCHCHQGHKENKRSFKMKEVTFVANEFLETLDGEITELRKNILQAEIDTKAYAKNFLKLVKSIEYQHKNADFIRLKKSNKFKQWKQATREYRNEFYFQQGQIISEILVSEIKMLQGKIMNETYIYHQLLLNGFDKISVKKFKNEVHTASRAVIRVRQQAWLQVKNIIDDIELKGLKFSFIWQFTGWDRIKLQIAIALIQQKRLLIIDDTLAKQSKQYKNEFGHLIEKLQKNYNLTIVIISKYGYRVIDVAQKVIILQNGDIVQQDTKENIIVQPFNKDVLQAISSPHLNWFAYFNYTESWLLINNINIVSLKTLYMENKNFSFNVAILPEKIVPDFYKHKVKVINKQPLYGWVIKLKKMRKGDWLLDVILNDNKIIKVIIPPSNNKKFLKEEIKFDILLGGIYLFDSKTDQLIKRW
ncbi:hypothetical protein [Spiroplasma endosymbiont of Eupeodes luniger]|uniref:hypothetical protein n=1 Tax=Spiroplasma endosymbiont of Eupeodes luniger TaxID=3066300 RepID=UPI0030D06926